MVTWSNTPSSGDFNDNSNWEGGVAPDNVDTVSFGDSGTKSLFFSTALTQTLGWTFDAGAANSYTVDVATGQTVIIGGTGITIDSGAVSFSVSGVFGLDGGNLADASVTIAGGANLEFSNAASAGQATVISDGFVIFTNNTSAGQAAITNNAGGFVNFYGTSKAGTATIDNDGNVQFFINSSAESANIINHFFLQFFDSATAGDATIITRSGAGTLFHNTSDGGNARLITDPGGFVDLSFALGPNSDNKIATGSIEGAGDYSLGSNEFTVGGNNLTTEVSGDIKDGGTNGGGGASLVKVGTGTLTLSSNNNTYSGGTTINEGTLIVDGTILGSTQVNDGGTLGGSGTVHAVNVAAGGTLSPGASAGQLHTDDVTLAAGAHFKAELGGTTAGSGHDQLAVTGVVTLNGAILDGSLINGFDPNNLAADTFTVIDNDAADAVIGAFAGLAQGARLVIDERFFFIDYQGGDGNDVVLTSAGAICKGTSGSNIIDATHAPAGGHMATVFDDIINGFGGNDTIRGLGGNDVITGGKGKDSLGGGLGADNFDFNSIKDSVKGSKRDTIIDFKHSQNDKIDLAGIDAKTGVVGNQKFTWIGKNDFHDKKGELHYVKHSGSAWVEGDVNGDGNADFQIKLAHVTSLAKADFVL